jgi:hypothetical protein
LASSRDRYGELEAALERQRKILPELSARLRQCRRAGQDIGDLLQDYRADTIWQVRTPKQTNMVRPGDFPIASPQSRAAARAMLHRAEAGRKRIEIVSNISLAWHGEGPKPEGWNGVPRIGPWQDCGDSLMRMVYRPGEWKRTPPENIPVCPGCGKPFRRADKQIGD